MPLLRELPLTQIKQSGAEKLSVQLKREWPEVTAGLYVFFFINTPALNGDGDIRDNNKKREKPVVLAGGASVKPGKFEQSLWQRIHNYEKHLHVLEHDQSQRWRFRESIEFGWVFDLSGKAVEGKPAALVFEKFWVAAANKFMKDKKLLVDFQRFRAEWRHVSLALTTDEALRNEFREYMEACAKTILKFVAIANRL